jgi:hypothetical protein
MAPIEWPIAHQVNARVVDSVLLARAPHYFHDVLLAQLRAPARNGIGAGDDS